MIVNYKLLSIIVQRDFLYEMVVLLNYRKICKLLSEILHRICMMMMADNDNIKLSKYPQTAFLGALF